ncbi:hypothetical protein Leryth_023195 [Lithospermum erythrorhizon]|nr:hypothetical protein Leryth_023195 [Lithospermum erythrorhizon]
MHQSSLQLLSLSLHYPHALPFKMLFPKQVSMTRVQNMEDMYNGSTIVRSRLPLVAPQPNNAPQLNITPRNACGCTNKINIISLPHTRKRH